MTGQRTTPYRSHHAALLAAVLLLMVAGPALAQTHREGPFLEAGAASDLRMVRPNDNTRPAGTVRDGTRVIDLEVTRADWRVEGPRGPGLRVAAIGETGGVPEIPAPLVRVETGTRLSVTVRNRLSTETITVFGLQPHPVAEADSFVVAAGASETVEFEAGAPGTYIYWMREGPEPDPESPAAANEHEQLAGAFVVDPPGERPDDRILVMNIFSEPVDAADLDGNWYEGLAINGLSWPFTERMKLQVGDDVRWRVINASIRNHPMHLHGFFYEVLSRGTATGDTIYAPDDRRLVVTETMRGRTTMEMAWTPSRPGRWLFHCHLSFHVSPDLRLPGAAEADPDAAHTHMAGLVTGIEVAPGPSDLVVEGSPVAVDLYAVEQPGEDGAKDGAEDDAADGVRYAFATGSTLADEPGGRVPGPVLAFQRHQAVDVTVHNRLSVPTGVHWHGLELDAWSDGVPDWSASAGRSSPVIQPGEAFTYRLSMMRPGTFIYHTHLDDIHQLTSGGLYGALLVLPEGETYDPRTDHVLVWGWRTSEPRSLDDVALNGGHEQPERTARVGERHRFRVINIAPAGNITAWITRGDGTVEPITLHAKDGADLPERQRVAVETLPRLFVGETADFTWIPTEPGTYELGVGGRAQEGRYLGQRWVVTE